MKLALTHGFGNKDIIIDEVSFNLTNTKRIGKELRRLVKGQMLTIRNPAWTWTTLPDGKIVIDYGSYTHFGLIYEISPDEREALFSKTAKNENSENGER